MNRFLLPRDPEIRLPAVRRAAHDLVLVLPHVVLLRIRAGFRPLEKIAVFAGGDVWG